MCFVSVYFGDGIGAILFARRASLLNCRVRFPMTCQPLPTYPTALPFTESLFSVFRGVSGSKLCCAEAILALLQSLHDWGIKLNPEPQTLNTAWERCETVIPYISYTMSRGLCSQMAWEGCAMVGLWVGKGDCRSRAAHANLTCILRGLHHQPQHSFLDHFTRQWPSTRCIGAIRTTLWKVHWRQLKTTSRHPRTFRKVYPEARKAFMKVYLSPQNFATRGIGAPKTVSKMYRQRTSAVCIHSGRGTRDLTKLLYLVTLDCQRSDGEATSLTMIGSRLLHAGPCVCMVFPLSGRDFFAFA